MAQAWEERTLLPGRPGYLPRVARSSQYEAQIAATTSVVTSSRRMASVTAKTSSRASMKSTSRPTRSRRARPRRIGALAIRACFAGWGLAGLRMGSPIEHHLTGHPCENGWWGVLGDAPRAHRLLVTVATVSRNRQPRAPRSMLPDQLEERRRQLRQAYKAGFHLLVRCGHCPNRRLLDELALAHDVQHDTYGLVSMLPTSARPGSAYGPGTQVADQDGNLLPGGITRPSVTRAKGASDAPNRTRGVMTCGSSSATDVAALSTPSTRRAGSGSTCAPSAKVARR
jgi:hypothetical protein